MDFACEATLNIAKRPDILALMREARFVTMFCGIETPEDGALTALNKRHNLRSPILEAVATINAHGIEVVSGMIVGLDTDTPTTYEAINGFVDASGIPVLTINLLHALPNTPLWRRLEQEGRLLDDPGEQESNVVFRRPYDEVLDGWRRCISHAYDPARVYARFRRQMDTTYPHRLPLPRDTPRARPRALLRGLRIMARLTMAGGVQADYRREFWRTARHAVRHRDPDGLFQAATVSHHLIRYTRDALAGRAPRAFYAPPAVPVSRQPKKTSASA